jgi:hypothetical protein
MFQYVDILIATINKRTSCIHDPTQQIEILGQYIVLLAQSTDKSFFHFKNLKGQLMDLLSKTSSSTQEETPTPRKAPLPHQGYI